MEMPRKKSANKLAFEKFAREIQQNEPERYSEEATHPKKVGSGVSVIDTYILIPLRVAVCDNCAICYQGSKAKVFCCKCGIGLETKDIAAKKKVPTGIWNTLADLPTFKVEEYEEGNS